MTHNLRKLADRIEKECMQATCTCGQSDCPNITSTVIFRAGVCVSPLEKFRDSVLEEVALELDRVSEMCQKVKKWALVEKYEILAHRIRALKSQVPTNAGETSSPDALKSGK